MLLSYKSFKRRSWFWCFNNKSLCFLMTKSLFSIQFTMGKVEFKKRHL